MFSDFAESVSVMVIISITVVLMMGVMIIVDLIRGYIKEYYLVAIGMLCVYAAAIFQMVTYFQKTKLFSGATLAMGLLLLLAFAIADSSNFLTREEAYLGLYSKIPKAVSTSLPLMASNTKQAFVTEHLA